MNWYTPQLLQTNSNLMTYGAQMQNKALQGMLDSVTGGINDLSNYKAKQEDEAYRNLLAQHLNSFQHQNVGTENERINPLVTSNGTNFNDYRTNAMKMVSGMTADRAGSIFQKALANRALQAQNQQQLLNSNIKQTAQNQNTIMNNYINKVGDTNKDGFVDYRDLNQTEQTVLQGLYGSVSKGLLDTANNNKNFLAQSNIKDKLATNRENLRYKHNIDVTKMGIDAREKQFEAQKAYQTHQFDVNKKIALMSSYRTQIQDINKRLIPFYSIAPSQMTEDVKANMQRLIQQRNNYMNSLNLLQRQIGGVQQPNQQQGGSSLLSTVSKPSLTDKYTQPQVTSQPSIFNQNQDNGQKGLTVKGVSNQSTSTKLVTPADINIPNGTNAQVTKALEDTNKARKNYNEIDKKAKDNLFFNFLKNGIAEKANKNVKSSSPTFIKQNTNVIKNTVKTLQEHLDYMDRKGFDPETGYTARLYALRQKSKLENAVAYAKEHNIKIDKSAKKLNGIIDGFINRSGNTKDYYTNIYVEGYNSLLHTKNAILGKKSTFMHPSSIQRTMVDFGKTLMQYAPDYANNRYGDGGLHAISLISDDYAKKIATKALPTLKDYIAKNTGIPSNSITDDVAQEWLYNQIGDPSTNELDYMGSFSRLISIGSLNNQVVNKKGKFNLQGFLNTFKAQKAK